MNSAQPCRGDLWLINFDPTATVGAEIRKKRPGLIISTDALGRLPLRIVVPITGWRDRFRNNFWLLRLEPDEKNGLQKASAADVLQLRCMDETRLIRRLGVVNAEILQEINYALLAIVDFSHFPNDCSQKPL